MALRLQRHDNSDDYEYDLGLLEKVNRFASTGEKRGEGAGKRKWEQERRIIRKELERRRRRETGLEDLERPGKSERAAVAGLES